MGAGFNNCLDKISQDDEKSILEQMTQKGVPAINMPGNATKEEGNSWAVAEMGIAMSIYYHLKTDKGMSDEEIHDMAQKITTPKNGTEFGLKIFLERKILESAKDCVLKKDTPEDLPKKSQYLANEIIDSPKDLDNWGKTNPLKNKKVLIMTAGSIGKILIELYKKAGAEVHVWHHSMTKEQADALGINLVGNSQKELNDAISSRNFDIIQVTTPLLFSSPLNNSTTNLITNESLKKHSGFLSVLSRNNLVDLELAQEWAEKGENRFFHLDAEPAPIANKLGSKNTLITPHTGAETKQAQENIATSSIDALVKYIKTGVVSNCINPECSEKNDNISIKNDSKIDKNLVLPPKPLFASLRESWNASRDQLVKDIINLVTNYRKDKNDNLDERIIKISVETEINKNPKSFFENASSIITDFRKNLAALSDSSLYKDPKEQISF